MNDSEYFAQIETYKLVANHSLGQNFLANRDVAKAIVSQLNIVPQDKILEIGAGLGSLSYYLVQNPAKITLIDVDERMTMFLREHFSESEYPNVTIKRRNILKENVSSYTKIIGNLPYYITTGIIEHLLLNASNCSEILLMVQKEVLPRLMPNTKNVSPLSLYLNYVASIEPSIAVGRGSFTPIPHVDSAVFKLIPNEHIKDPDGKYTYQVMSRIFLHRRKTILNCLTDLMKDRVIATVLVDELKVSPLMRPEQLDINFYLALTKKLKSIDFTYSSPTKRSSYAS